MIVKYYQAGVWGYIDNIRQVATTPIDTEEMIMKYNKEVESKEREDIASYMNGEKLPTDIAMSNKVFLLATENEIHDIGEVHQENLIAPDLVARNFPAKIILLYLNEHKEYENVVLITNQTTYLMNDNGKTIERLV